MPLTDVALRALKPRQKPYKQADGLGLYILVKPNGKPEGAKYWRFKYRLGGKEKLLSLGKYPDVGLKAARDTRDEERKKLRSGVDPSAERKARKAPKSESGTETFEVVAREWIEKTKPTWVAKHGDVVLGRLERDIFPWIGKRRIDEIDSPEMLQVLRRIEKRKVLSTAHRLRGTCSQVFRYAVASGRAQSDPCASLKGALAPAIETHHAFIREPKSIGNLLRAIDGYTGALVTQCALQLSPLLFVRPGELRHAEWSEIDLEAAEWRIPPEKMKEGVQHLVPLSRQAVEILKRVQPVTGQGRYVFPSIRTGDRPISDNTVNAALRRLGYEKTEMTGHGFRSMASTLLNEQGFSPDAIERQLAHIPRGVRAVYNYAEYLPERKRMMSAWADYLDKLRAQKS